MSKIEQSMKIITSHDVLLDLHDQIARLRDDTARHADSDRVLCNKSADAIERLENEALAATVRIDNDAMQLSECVTLLGESLQEARDAAVEVTTYQQAAYMQAAAHKVEIAGLTREQIGLKLDAARLDWLLPVVTGVSDDEADNRTLGLARQLVNGLDGRQAIDAAMKGGVEWH